VPATDGGEEWEQFFWSVFETSTIPLILLDEHRALFEVNDAMCDLLDAPRDQVLGSKVDLLAPPDERTTIDAEWEGFSRGEAWAGERTLLRPDGSTARVQYAVRPVKLAAEQLAIVVCLPVESVVDDDADETRPLETDAQLTTRERELLSFVVLGSTRSQIAEHLLISLESVRLLMHDAMAKTGARTRTQLVATAFAERHIIAAD
jgi:PAS domain S-box-containing protein